MVNSTPQIVCFSIYLYKHFIEMPFPVGMILSRMYPFIAYLMSEHWTKPIPPVSDSFMADIDASFMEQIFDVAQ